MKILDTVVDDELRVCLYPHQRALWTTTPSDRSISSHIYDLGSVETLFG